MSKFERLRALWAPLAIAFAGLAIAALAFAGCTRQAPATPAATSPTFKVALMTPGPVSDAGWNAAAFDGLQLIKKDLGADTSQVQNTSPADFEDSFRDFASRGYNLIFAHGFEYTDTAIKVAKLFPNTIFVITSGSRTSANVAALAFKIEEAAYVEGVLAGEVTKSGVVGAVGGIKLPTVSVTFDGFALGFHSIRPSGRMLVSYTGNFEDVGAAKEAALAQISQGADLLFHNADAAGLGVFQAAAQAHIYAFGTTRNQNDVMPETVLASAVSDVPHAFLKIASEVKAHQFHPAMIEFGMKEGMVRVILNPGLESKIPAAALEQTRLAEQQVIAGKVALPKMPALASGD
ncbi:MAG TPA: BMP family protein [Candidatus Binataceae bacterium]